LECCGNCRNTFFFYACQDNTNEINQLGLTTDAPAGIAEKINLKHTDSAKLKAHMLSDKMLDFSNKEFSYREFPEGIVLHFYNEKKSKEYGNCRFWSNL
jgi:hypothetical protein